MTAAYLPLLLALSVGTSRGNVSTNGWLVYRNAATGISFRYPPSLRVRERDTKEFGLPDAEAIVELTGATETDPEAIVLRFIVNRGSPDRKTVEGRSQALRKWCKSYTPLTIGSHRALVCVYCGRAACHWNVDILQPRECTILSLLGGEDVDETNPSPRDGTFPILTIIKTVEFEVAKK